MNLLQKQGFYNSLILYAGTALGFFNLIVLFQRILTIEEIGFFSLMTAISLLYAQIASAGINNIIVKYFPYYRSEDKRHGGFVSFILLWCVVSFLLVTILFFLLKSSIVAHYSGHPGSALLIKYFYYIAPLAFLTMIYTVLESLAITVFKNILSSFLREVFLRTFTLCGVLLISWLLADYHDFLNIYLLANLLAVVVLWFYIYKGKEFKLSAISTGITLRHREFINYGFFTLLSSASFVLIQNLDIISLSAITTDLKMVGIYNTFFAIAVVISLPAKALSRTSIQIISQAWAVNDLEKISKIYRKTSVMQMLLGCILFICLIINRRFILILLHKPEYLNYFKVFIIVGAGFLTDMTGGVNGYIINLSKYFRMTTIFIILAVIICAVLNYLLIKQMGMMGAAVAYFASMFTLNFMYWLFVYIKFKLQPFGKTHLLILLISIATLLVGLYCPVISNVWVDMLVRSALIILFYGALTLILKISEDIDLIWRKLSILKTNK